MEEGTAGDGRGCAHKCASMAKWRPSSACSEGEWKCSCTSLKVLEPTVIALSSPGASKFT